MLSRKKCFNRIIEVEDAHDLYSELKNDKMKVSRTRFLMDCLNTQNIKRVAESSNSKKTILTKPSIKDKKKKHLVKPQSHSNSENVINNIEEFKVLMEIQSLNNLIYRINEKFKLLQDKLDKMNAKKEKEYEVFKNYFSNEFKNESSDANSLMIID